MSICLSPPRLPQVPAVVPVAPVTLANHNSQIQPLDLLLITCESDFPDMVNLLSQEANRTQLNFEIVRIEELEGSTAGQKLASLHHRIGELVASGGLHASSATCVALHGGTRAVATDVTNEEFIQQHPDLADFASSIGQELGEESADESDSESGTSEAFIHLFSACKESLTFPSLLFLDSARHATMAGDNLEPGYLGPIFIASCEGGSLINCITTGGEYVLLNGKKNGLASDGDECMLEVINMMAERRRQNMQPFTGRDYWMQLRNVSGEHIAYVGETSNEIHKVLAFGHCEPVITLRNSQAAGQPVRLLHAKLAHGSPKALQAVFDRYKEGELGELDANECLLSLAFDTYRGRDELQEKIDILDARGLHLPNHAESMAEVLEAAIACKNLVLLGILLTLDDGGARPQALLQSAKACVFVQPETAAKLQALCELQPVLKLLVADWLNESIEAARSGGLTHYFDVSAAPYFAQLLFDRLLVGLPPAIRLALSRHLKIATKDKHRSEILNTVIWGDVEAAWNLAKKGAIFTFPNQSESDALKLMPPAVNFRKRLQ